jgi:DNA-binding transcriptional ArsR family regulator
VVKEKSKEKEWLKEELDELGERMNRLETILDEISKPLSRYRELTSNYFKLIDLYSEHGMISPELIVPEVKDPISKDIVNVLFHKSEQNISQITELLRKRRGSASRRIVREKLKELEDKGYIVKESISRQQKFSVSPELTKKWSQLLGFYK